VAGKSHIGMAVAAGVGHRFFSKTVQKGGRYSVPRHMIGSSTVNGDQNARQLVDHSFQEEIRDILNMGFLGRKRSGFPQ